MTAALAVAAVMAVIAAATIGTVIGTALLALALVELFDVLVEFDVLDGFDDSDDSDVVLLLLFPFCARFAFGLRFFLPAAGLAVTGLVAADLATNLSLLTTRRRPRVAGGEYINSFLFRLTVY